jgi:hypothetical protein
MSSSRRLVAAGRIGNPDDEDPRREGDDHHARLRHRILQIDFQSGLQSSCGRQRLGTAPVSGLPEDDQRGQRHGICRQETVIKESP